MPSVLVVDDSMLIRHTVCRFFEQLGFRVESATNGEEALEMLQSVRPDIMITDLQMPKMDGLEMIRILKKKPQTASIPIVVLAPATSRSDKSVGGEADFVVFKDIDLEGQLQQVLKKTLRFPEASSGNSSQG